MPVFLDLTKSKHFYFLIFWKKRNIQKSHKYRNHYFWWLQTSMLYISIWDPLPGKIFHLY